MVRMTRNVLGTYLKTHRVLEHNLSQKRQSQIIKYIKKQQSRCKHTTTIGSHKLWKEFTTKTVLLHFVCRKFVLFHSKANPDSFLFKVLRRSSFINDETVKDIIILVVTMLTMYCQSVSRGHAVFESKTQNYSNDAFKLYIFLYGSASKFKEVQS